jgi:SAM-dependent methyltransferase
VALAVTTPLHADAATAAAAAEAAARHGGRYVPRANRPAAEVLREAGADALLVLSARAAVLLAAGQEGPGERWSPGMGVLRARRAARARALGRPPPPEDRDPFLEACALREGDHVLDATLGLGADALVAAEAVGPSGRVVGLEASPALAAWVAEGLRRLPAPAARRIEVRAAEHGAALAALPAGSFDVVVFDPMFRHARAAPGGFDAVRALADARPLDAAALARARAVARRHVVVKDGAPGWDLTRLGLVPLPSARGAHRYYARLEATGPPGARAGGGPPGP